VSATAVSCMRAIVVQAEMARGDKVEVRVGLAAAAAAAVPPADTATSGSLIDSANTEIGNIFPRVVCLHSLFFGSFRMILSPRGWNHALRSRWRVPSGNSIAWRRSSSVSAAELRFGQPVHETHPHLLKAGEGMARTSCVWLVPCRKRTDNYQSDSWYHRARVLRPTRQARESSPSEFSCDTRRLRHQDAFWSCLLQVPPGS
jgi:hypothetical protein